MVIGPQCWPQQSKMKFIYWESVSYPLVITLYSCNICPMNSLSLHWFVSLSHEKYIYIKIYKVTFEGTQWNFSSNCGSPKCYLYFIVTNKKLTLRNILFWSLTLSKQYKKLCNIFFCHGKITPNLLLVI